MEKEREVCTEALFESQLRLAIDVLTSKSCSEDGLEDATNLLLQLSKANAATRVAVLQLLLQGARQMGLVVCTHIRSLCSEARELCLVEEANREDDKDEDDQKTQKGVVKDRRVFITLTTFQCAPLLAWYFYLRLFVDTHSRLSW